MCINCMISTFLEEYMGNSNTKDEDSYRITQNSHQNYEITILTEFIRNM